MTRMENARKRIEARAKLIKQLADEFEASGVAFTCRAVVQDFAEKRIVPLTENMPAEWLVHRTFAFRNLKRDVADEMSRRLNERK